MVTSSVGVILVHDGHITCHLHFLMSCRKISVSEVEFVASSVACLGSKKLFMRGFLDQSMTLYNNADSTTMLVFNKNNANSNRISQI